jgi:peptidoglycan/LPS O-acetylase OafA/YrhL
MYPAMRDNGMPTFDDGSFFPLQLQYFLFGSVAYRVYVWFKSSTLSSIVKQRIYIIALVLAVLMIFKGLAIMRPQHRWVYDIFYLSFALTIPFVFTLAANWKYDSQIGEYSYPIYLFHYAVAIASEKFLLDTWRGEAVLIVTVLLSSLYIFLIDPPVQRIRKRIAARHQLKNSSSVGRSIPSNGAFSIT